MINQCCKDTLQELQSKLKVQAEELLKFAGKRESVMEEAAYRRAEIIIDVMGTIKEFAISKAK